MWGGLCHAIFLAAAFTMIWVMFHGMRRSSGTVPQPLAWAVKLALVFQFLLGHSLFLTRGGQRLLTRLAPFGFGATLSVTAYATIASVAVGLLFALWTPSGTVWGGPKAWRSGCSARSTAPARSS